MSRHCVLSCWGPSSLSVTEKKPLDELKKNIKDLDVVLTQSLVPRDQTKVLHPRSMEGHEAHADSCVAGSLN